ncbi:MAG: polyprenyl synthetase family protein [Firmicutes bacterium]|nr:polyprenyl synthetase family protein [Bacillota bacterium]
MNGTDLFGAGGVLLPDENDELFTPLRAILAELLATPGKGLRGEMLILSAGGLQAAAAQPQLQTLAFGFELLHLATLVHDDLLDQSERRRGRPAVWKRWGDKTAVLVGDYLFATAYRMISSVCGPDSMERVHFLLREMVGGELAEETDRFRLIPAHRYLARIEKKTARFFQVAGELGGDFAGLSRENCTELGEFGRKLGMAYQLYDDLQDLTGDGKSGGKPVFQDLKNGVLTLPLLLISDQPGFDEVLAEVQAKGKVLPKHRQLIRKWLATRKVSAKIEGLIGNYCREAKAGLAGLNLPQFPLLCTFADGLFDPEAKQKKTKKTFST